MERIQTRSLMVVKQDMRREEFNRNKLVGSLTKACTKRPLPMGTLDRVAEDIETELVESGRSEVGSQAIGEMVMDRLRGIDRVAYIRYASVYRDFKDPEDFRAEVDSLSEPQAEKAAPSPQLSFLDDAPPPASQPVRRRRGRPRRNPQPAR